MFLRKKCNYQDNPHIWEWLDEEILAGLAVCVSPMFIIFFLGLEINLCLHHLQCNPKVCSSPAALSLRLIRIIVYVSGKRLFISIGQEGFLFSQCTASQL